MAIDRRRAEVAQCVSAAAPRRGSHRADWQSGALQGHEDSAAAVGLEQALRLAHFHIYGRSTSLEAAPNSAQGGVAAPLYVIQTAPIVRAGRGSLCLKGFGKNPFCER